MSVKRRRTAVIRFNHLRGTFACVDCLAAYMAPLEWFDASAFLARPN